MAFLKIDSIDSAIIESKIMGKVSFFQNMRVFYFLLDDHFRNTIFVV